MGKLLMNFSQSLIPIMNHGRKCAVLQIILNQRIWITSSFDLASFRCPSRMAKHTHYLRLGSHLALPPVWRHPVTLFLVALAPFLGES